MYSVIQFALMIGEQNNTFACITTHTHAITYNLTLFDTQGVGKAANPTYMLPHIPPHLLSTPVAQSLASHVVLGNTSMSYCIQTGTSIFNQVSFCPSLYDGRTGKGSRGLERYPTFPYFDILKYSYSPFTFSHISKDNALHLNIC